MKALFFYSDQCIVLLFIKSYKQLLAFIKEKPMICKGKSCQGPTFSLLCNIFNYWSLQRPEDKILLVYFMLSV